MPKIRHLAHQTPNSMLREMFQISNFFGICYNAIPLMEPHCSVSQNFLFTLVGLFLSHACYKIFGFKEIKRFFIGCLYYFNVLKC